MSDTAKKFISANELYVDSFKLARKVYDDGFRPTIIVGIWRGGTPPGIVVEEFFRVQGCKSFHTAIRTRSYTGIESRSSIVEITGLEQVIDIVNADDRLLLIDDVFDTGGTMKAVVEKIKSMARRNTPEIKIASLFYKPLKNKVDIKPDYYLHECADWLVFPHELQGLSTEELAQKWDPAILKCLQAPGGPFAVTPP